MDVVTIEKISRRIFEFEARRDSEGKLVVHVPGPGDGGGRYEVAGFTEKYWPKVAGELRGLVLAGRQGEAEVLAVQRIGEATECVRNLSEVDAIGAYLMDCGFNRGTGGAVRMLQRALRVKVDGKFGRISQGALEAAERQPEVLLLKLREAREWWEREVVGRDEGSKYWRGLVRRWDEMVLFCQELLARRGR